MPVRANADSSHDLLSYNDVYPALGCTPHGTECDHGSPATPSSVLGLANTNNNKAASQNATHAALDAAQTNATTTITIPSTNPIPTPTPSAPPKTSTPQNEAAADVNRLGQRNFVGFLVLAVLILIGLALWMAFGRWPKRKIGELRKRLAARRRGGGGYRSPGSADAEALQAAELGGDQQPSRATAGEPHLRGDSEKFPRDEVRSECALNEGVYRRDAER